MLAAAHNLTRRSARAKTNCPEPFRAGWEINIYLGDGNPFAARIAYNAKKIIICPPLTHEVNSLILYIFIGWYTMREKVSCDLYTFSRFCETICLFVARVTRTRGGGGYMLGTIKREPLLCFNFFWVKKCTQCSKSCLLSCSKNKFMHTSSARLVYLCAHVRARRKCSPHGPRGGKVN